METDIKMEVSWWICLLLELFRKIQSVYSQFLENLDIFLTFPKNSEIQSFLLKVYGEFIYFLNFHEKGWFFYGQAIEYLTNSLRSNNLRLILWHLHVLLVANGDAKNGDEERKRKTDDDDIVEEVQPAKKAKLVETTVEEDDDIVCID